MIVATYKTKNFIHSRSWRNSNAPARHAGVVGAIPTGLTMSYGCRLTVGHEALTLGIVVRVHAPVPIECRLHMAN